MSELSKLKLPAWKTFNSKSKEHSPYELFHFWVSAQVDNKPSDKQINVSASWLHPEDMERLDAVAKRWIQAAYKENGKAWANQALMWHRLDVSPANWQEGKVPAGKTPGFVYVNTEILYRSK